MTPRNFDGFKAAVKNVVRGEAHWSELRKFGFDISKSQSGWYIGSYLGAAYEVNESDLEEALMRIPQDERAEWASFVLSAAGIIDFARLDGIAKGDELINILWDLAFPEHGPQAP